MDSSSLDETAKQLKRNLESWREIVVQLEGLLAWKRPTDPAIIAALTSLAFLLFWYLDPSLLTTFSLFGLAAAIADFAVPRLSAKFFPADYWNATKEKKLEDVCAKLAGLTYCTCAHWQCYCEMRSTQPSKFYAITLPSLAVLAWIGSSINNILLTYLAVTLILMMPGLSKKGLLAPVRNLITMTCCRQDVKKDN